MSIFRNKMRQIIRDTVAQWSEVDVGTYYKVCF